MSYAIGRIGNRALPVLWEVVETKGAIGFDVQGDLLDKACACVPDKIRVMLAADRFYGTPALVGYCRDKEWGYRTGLRLPTFSA